MSLQNYHSIPHKNNINVVTPVPFDGVVKSRPAAAILLKLVLRNAFHHGHPVPVARCLCRRKLSHRLGLAGASSLLAAAETGGRVSCRVRCGDGPRGDRERPHHLVLAFSSTCCAQIDGSKQAHRRVQRGKCTMNLFSIDILSAAKPGFSSLYM